MNKKNISPNPQQPVDRVPAGQLPSALAELTEASLNATHAIPHKKSFEGGGGGGCSYEGDDAE
ncbi:DUF5837 family cyanobactin class RiPP [Spirulina sp. CCNP1310]|uniref:DUF5837 family cyanobactin class RiPP n=1 Tax=Spirulina sp. CCNP1310 TaxID=3110249 RepID=UPI002B1F677A|nr:DUF5837 family cyanobactin class RiPP [Spirulina sp. CCNP1310]MEA5420816.1 DUF5837 family cyanobactin class RiPP [Spirulina sp. CCNP1310]